MYKLQKADLNNFIVSLAGKYHVLAPVRTDAIRFQEVKSADAIDLSGNSYLPIKQFFFPQEETLFKFAGDKINSAAAGVGDRVSSSASGAATSTPSPIRTGSTWRNRRTHTTQRGARTRCSSACIALSPATSTPSAAAWTSRTTTTCGWPTAATTSSSKRAPRAARSWRDELASYLKPTDEGPAERDDAGHRQAQDHEDRRPLRQPGVGERRQVVPELRRLHDDLSDLLLPRNLRHRGVLGHVEGLRGSATGRAASSRSSAASPATSSSARRAATASASASTTRSSTTANATA